MYIEKIIRLRNINYYIRVELEYKKNNDTVCLSIKNYNDNYYDSGDFSLLLEKIAKNYTFEKAKIYDENIFYMADILYLYDRIPFLSGIRNEDTSKEGNIPHTIGYITKEEIEKYIKNNDIKMHNNTNFKLYDERTWFI